MSTDLQEDLAEALVINKKLPRHKRKNKRDLLVSTGYSKITAESIPSKIIEAKGVKDALKEFGLTEELITTALVFDIEHKPKQRVKELSLGAEILGMKKEVDKPKVQVNLIFNGEQTKRIAREVLNDSERSEESSD